MKACLIIFSGICLLLNSAVADVFTFEKDDPFIVISWKRAREVVLSVKKRESIELLFGKGIRRDKGKVEYPIRTPPGVRPSGFAGSIVVEYDAHGQALRCDVLVQAVGDANLEYPGEPQ